MGCCGVKLGVNSSTGLTSGGLGRPRFALSCSSSPWRVAVLAKSLSIDSPGEMRGSFLLRYPDTVRPKGPCHMFVLQLKLNPRFLSSIS